MDNRFLAKFFRAAPAAIAAASLGFAPAAFGDLSIIYPDPESGMQLEAGGAGDFLMFLCEEDDDLNAAGAVGSFSTTVSASPAGIVRFQRVDGDGNAIGNAANSVSVPMYESSNGLRLPVTDSQVFVTGIAPGTAEITLRHSNLPRGAVTIQAVVSAPEDIAFRQTRNGDAVSTIMVAETDLANSGSFYLDFGYNINQAVNFSITSSDDGSHLAVQNALRVAKGASNALVNFSPKNGPASVTLTFTGDTAYTDGASVNVVITNAPPQLSSPGGTSERPTSIRALQGAPTTFSAYATDVAADTVSYIWSVNGSVYRTTTTPTCDIPIDSEGTVTVQARDNNGGLSRVGYWEVELVDSSTILFTDACTITSITDVQGNGLADFYTGEASSTTFQDHALKPHSTAGNKFYAGQAVSVRAEPKQTAVSIQGASVQVTTYPFGWFFSDNTLTDEANLYIPNDSTAPILIQTPSAGGIATIRYFSSTPYRGYYDENALYPIDAFGDFDQDGLSDRWEAYYFDGGKEGVQRTSTDWGTLAVANATGLYGASGTSYAGGAIVVTEDTPDNDRLPTKSVEDIPNVWASDPYYDPDGENLVRAYLYPLTGNYVNYGTYIGDLSEFTSHGNLVYPNGAVTVDGAEKPFFDNLTEFRGVPQARESSSADWENAPNFVRVGYPGILTRANTYLRGNCPGTDPTVDDTDGDAMSDGWEYYFWTTVLYENKPEYWRAFDPTFTLYPNLAPLGSADFRGAGIPLLKRDIDEEDTVQYAGGMILRRPDEEFKPTIIRSDCYYGYPLIQGGGGEGVRLTNAPICHLVYIDESIDAESGYSATTNAAVEFVMGDSFRVFTRDGYVDARGRAKLWYQPHQDNAAEPPVEIDGAYVDFFSGEFYLPGYDNYPSYIQELIGSRDAVLTARYRFYNGIFPKQWILNKFDPNNELAPNFACDTAGILNDLGLDPAFWNPDSDLDNDGLPDLDEYFLGTNPLHWDTDNDGMPDGWEVIFGLDPHDRSDGSGNPDGDSMYAVGPYRHVDAFLYEYWNQVYWNGQASLGFVPGVATIGAIPDAGIVTAGGTPFTNREEFYLQKWMMGKEGKYPFFTMSVYPAMWQITYDDSLFAFKSTHPRNDDTSEDHIPDGWALYTGYIPNSALLSETTTTNTRQVGDATITTETTVIVRAVALDFLDYTWQNFFGIPPYCPGDLRDDPDQDGLTWRQEFEAWNVYDTRAAQCDSGSYVAENVVTYHNEEWYKPTREDWTNKLLPTSPWLADTDGDGVSDAAEYQEEPYDDGGVDYNGDRNRLVNFNPCTADTTFDRLPDGWKLLGGLYDTTNAPWGPVGGTLTDPFGPYGDPDCDGVPNYQEYLTGAVYAWRYDWWYSPEDKAIWMPDINMDADNLAMAVAVDPYCAQSFSVDPIVVDGVEVGPAFFVDAFPYGKSVHFRPYRSSDFMREAPSPVYLAQCQAVVRRLEKRWKEEITHVNPYTGDVKTAAGWDRTFSPTIEDLAIAETNASFVVSEWANWMQRAWALLHDRLERYELDIDPETLESKDTAFISVAEYQTIDGFVNTLLANPPQYSYGCIPAAWESAWADNTKRAIDAMIPVAWSFIPNKFLGVAGYPGTMPRNPDTDNDGMDDYWEIYHGLNPIYGGSWSLAKGGGYPDSDRADRHMLGDGSKNDWIMGNDVARVRNLTPTEIGLQPVMRSDDAFHVENAAFHTPITYLPIASAARFDYKTRPWLAGDPTADPDQDGISNQEESINEHMPDVMQHTDPSPYWFTDPSYAESYANLYYAVDGEMGVTRWWWDQSLTGQYADGPSYLFDFEINEGFDTDNDNVSDREEISSDNATGVTDPLDLDSPRSRKALYLDGHAAARTRNPYFHDKWTLTSYTVEFWCRPQELPGPGKRATLVQRPVYMPVDDSSGATRYRIRHTFLVQLDELGQVHAQVDNDALETVSSATAVSAGRLVPDHWTHVAVVMDSVADSLAIYLDGKFAGQTGAGLKPCTGYIQGAEYLLAPKTDGATAMWENYRFYDYSPAPIVIGAYDRNPLGVVTGPYESSPWGLPAVAGGRSQPDFDPDQYFKGWIDEVRIWDRCRTQDQIMNAMTKRFTKEDIEKVNHERWRWEMQGWAPGAVGSNVVALTTMGDLPQKLLYHYSFDNLPDVLAAPDRDTSFASFFSADSTSSPLGWNDDAVARCRPSPFWTAPEWYPYASTILPHLVPWWYTATHRSNVYTDYTYVPFIENTVAHMPQSPPLDVRGLVPNYDDSFGTVVLNDGTTATMQLWNLLSYRRRSEADWALDAMADEEDIIPATLAANGSSDVQLAQIRNSMNPYGMFYRTAVCYANENHPYMFPGELDRYGTYHDVPVLSDMLPLMDAVADIDVEMWDGRGRGTDIVSVDTDGDGLPDWWEIAHGLDPNSAEGADGAYGDRDGDGLDNFAEYLAGTDPFRYDTDSDGYSDYFSRLDGRSLTWGELYDDGDGMDNAWEQLYGLDPERYDANGDTDGDGWSNWEEYMAGTDPSRSDSFPEPSFNVKFYYDDKYVEQGQLYVYTYGEKYSRYPYAADDWLGGPIAGYSNWGGAWNGKYSGLRTELLQNLQVFTNVKIGETVMPSVSGYQLSNTDIGLGARLDYGASSYEAALWENDNDYYIFGEEEGLLILLDYRNGRVLLVGTGAAVAAGGTGMIRYSISPRAYPLTVENMARSSTLMRQHMVSGYNRFFGWLDLDDNGEYDVGEPAGISRHRPTLVSWDSVDAEIPLTDELWGFPRVSWIDTDPYGIPTDHYTVSFVYQVGTVSNSTSAVAYDPDLDGLDEWGETKAGTDADDADTGDTGYSDYYKVDPSTGLTYGELWDDGDGIPNNWERNVSVGRPVALDPDRYDATEDPDSDGWTNWEEYMGGTDPTDAGQFPVPRLDVTFDYAGSVSNMARLVVYSYAEKTAGEGYGGTPDGEFMNVEGVSYGQTVVDGSQTAVIGGYERYVRFFQGYRVASATFTYTETQNGSNTTVTVECPHSNDEYGWFSNESGSGTFGIQWETGTVFAEGSFVGTPFSVSVIVDGYNFPFVEKGLLRRKGTHLVSGWNRFFGFADENMNGEYDVGEPAGLSIRRPVLAGFDTASGTIPLTDGLFGYPRFSWPTNNASQNGYYTVQIWRDRQGSGFDAKVAEVKIAKPRNFFHEGDLLSAGIMGLPFGSATSASFHWTVYDGDDTGSALANQVWPLPGAEDPQNAITYNFQGMASADNTYGYAIDADTGRRAMEAIYPKSGETVHGPLVDFRWTMDHRTEGAVFTVKNLDDGKTYIDNLVVPLPWRHGKYADGSVSDDYPSYYSAAPQLENGKSLVELPAGRYSYTISERVDSSGFSPQSVSGVFTLENDDAGQGRHALSGNLYYWGRVQDWAAGAATFPADVVIQAYEVPERARSGASPSGNPVAQTRVTEQGAYEIHGLRDGTYAVLAFVDQNGNGVADDWETQGYGVVRGTASPVFYGNPAPLVVTNADVEAVSVVLHDRDTDNDSLPDSWEWKKFGSLSAHYGSEMATGSKTWLQVYAEDPVGAPAGTPFFFPEGSEGGLDSLDLTVTPVENWQTFYVRAPRTFLHEGDFEDAGVFGFPMGADTNLVVQWRAIAYTTTGADYYVGGGTFSLDAGARRDRREMKIGYPDQKTVVVGDNLEFEWEMDWRNAGVYMTIERLDDAFVMLDASGEPVLDDLGRPTLLPWAPTDGSEWTTVFSGVVPFPVRHGQKTNEDYYWSAVPQLEDGRTHLDLEPAYYRYKIVERPMTDAYAAQSVSGTFQVISEGNPKYELFERYFHTASGSIRYYGKTSGGLATNSVVFTGDAVEIATLAGGETAVEASYDGDVVRGSMVVEVVAPDGTVVDRLNDRATHVATEGLLFAESGTSAWSGSIVYPEAEGDPCTVHVVFSAPLEAGTKVLVAVKKFRSPVVVQAFKLPDNATTSVAISGQPIRTLTMDSKGDFEFKNLRQGKYAFRAFIDSNGNGFPDDWETQGVAVKTDTDSPYVPRTAEAIEIVSDVRNLRILLLDRDTDNDLLPDSWEYEMFGDITVHSGYDATGADGVLMLWQEYADGPLDSDPRTPDTDLDGLTDAMEILVTGTDTHLSDTDGDGVGDLEEFLSGSDPLDPAVAVPYTVPALEFDEDGAPFVECSWSAMPRGVVLTYVLQRKASLSDEAWEDVDELVVAATDPTLVSIADGVSAAGIAAGSATMSPADKLDTLDWKSGFFRVRVFADYGKMVDNGDGSFSYWTWNKSGEFVEVARGDGELVRDKAGNWQFVDRATRQAGSLIRREDGSWIFVK